MSIQILSLFALVAVACAAPGHLGYAAAPAVYAAAPAVYAAPAAVSVHTTVPVAQTVAVSGSNAREVIRTQDGFGNYASTYAVSDSLTGDHKSSSESGAPGLRVGAFSQLDPNGYERRTDYTSDIFGTHQAVTGSEYGLYVNAKDHSIRPHGHVAVAPVATYAAAPAIAPVAAAAYNAPLAHGAIGYGAYGAHGYGAIGYGAYGAHGYGGLGYGAYGAHGYGAIGYGAPHVKHIL